jgi:hypothetical protein
MRAAPAPLSSTVIRRTDLGYPAHNTDTGHLPIVDTGQFAYVLRL